MCPTADAVVRGHRSGLLTTADYNNLCQCETLDDIKLNLVSYKVPGFLNERVSLAFNMTGDKFTVY